VVGIHQGKEREEVLQPKQQEKSPTNLFMTGGRKDSRKGIKCAEVVKEKKGGKPGCLYMRRKV